MYNLGLILAGMSIGTILIKIWKDGIEAWKRFDQATKKLVDELN